MKQNRRLIPLLAAVASFMGCTHGRTSSTDRPAQSGIRQHVYRPGETFNYFFEDTENTYTTEVSSGITRVRDPNEFQELQVRLKVSIEAVTGGRVRKRVDLVDARYRSLKAQELTVPDRVRAPLRPVQELIPGFPVRFSYSYDTGDGQVVTELNHHFQKYLKNEMGNFLYYKLLDVHTFQGTIDHIPEEAVGQVAVLGSRDIPLEHGTFHNHRPVRLFQRVSRLDGLRQAYYKVVTLGNYYDMPDNRLESNYQYTFYVPLDGSWAGLLYSGELQEQVLIHPPGKPTTWIQRQLSLRLEPNASSDQ